MASAGPFGSGSMAVNRVATPTRLVGAFAHVVYGCLGMNRSSAPRHYMNKSLGGYAFSGSDYSVLLHRCSHLKPAEILLLLGMSTMSTTYIYKRVADIREYSVLREEKEYKDRRGGRRSHPVKSEMDMPRKYPWDTMETGDTFEVEGVDLFKFRRQCSNASRIFRRNYRCEKVGDAVVVMRVPDDYVGRGFPVFPHPDAIKEYAFIPAKGRELGALQVEVLKHLAAHDARADFQTRQIVERDQGIMIIRIGHPA